MSQIVSQTPLGQTRDTTLLTLAQAKVALLKALEEQRGMIEAKLTKPQ
jgi:hypothetical protein